MNYDKLTADERKARLEARLHALEAEQFENEMNRDLLAASGDDSEPVKRGIAEAESNIATIRGARSFVADRLKEFDGTAPTTARKRK